ncbi:hypothetical protein BT69DRAFT_1276139 [Atractiella rhizophila]|nr:hypothetical protein BT69DRAFT_1276139 [Atractiella rhizophila]
MEGLVVEWYDKNSSLVIACPSRPRQDKVFSAIFCGVKKVGDGGDLVKAVELEVAADFSSVVTSLGCCDGGIGD